MHVETIQLVGLCATASVLAAGMAVAILTRVFTRGEESAEAEAPSRSRTAFLIEGARLIDATEAGRAWLSALGPESWHWRTLERALTVTFPDLPLVMPEMQRRREATLTARDGGSYLHIRAEGTRLRLSVDDGTGAPVLVERSCYAALESELDGLRAVGDALPHPVWRQDADGQIVWMNRAYLDLLATCGDGTPGAWPVPPLFPDLTITGGESTRATLRGSPEGAGVHDCHAVAVGRDLVVSAVCADGLLAARAAQGGLAQTMSRTFAHLAVGLAIFDHEGQLVTFNPALIDLTTLPTDLLLSKPTLGTLLGALRARALVPPRGHAAWRRDVAEMRRAATEEGYRDVWTLPDGRAWRVTGQPQPEGTFAFTFEDVSAEAELARRTPAEIDLWRSALDAIDDAVAVFDEFGTLALSNPAYDALWSIEPTSTHACVRDAVEVWRGRCRPSPAWGEAAGFLMHDAAEGTGRCEWSEDVQMIDGRSLTVSFVPIAAKATMVRFEPARAILAPVRGTSAVARETRKDAVLSA